MKKLLTILLISIVFIQTGCEKEKPEEKVNEQELAQNNYTEKEKWKKKQKKKKKNIKKRKCSQVLYCTKESKKKIKS